MQKCEWCGEAFEQDEAEDYFNTEMGILVYRNVRKCLCGKCAVEAINDEVDGVYYETCEKCGRTFDLIVDKQTYSNHFSWFNGTNLYDERDNQILCADCAIEAATSRTDGDDDNTNSVIPEGCAACGGDWPRCTTSCPLYDE